MANFQRFHCCKILKCEKHFALKPKQLTEDEFAHLDWLNTINSVENKAIWSKKLQNSGFKGIELTFGSNKKNQWFLDSKNASSTKTTFVTETQCNSNLNNFNVLKYHDQSLKKNSIDYCFYFNFCPARFTADIKIPQSLTQRPPRIFRCDI
ncbi:Aminopeptidase YpdF [Dirofilaria immitis]